ncbi:hypothetical protein EOPP23_08460 [Endozoicomonas sp. OPT23]|uniref:hypothetical protein n=1 Tax=Endozoicomonas sp. OPT23 TaxID=2072845 RepID=UPI00129BBF50|nr:hypothetical protein [Endozoicomonas sp. OPT23]MRI33013.1 hypothetical protein [Endozoicomonas sp. OPT23]
MKTLLSLAVAIFAMAAMTTQAKPIYKCQKNGTTQYSESPCDSNATEVILKELSAPLKPMDTSALKGLDARAKVRKIEQRLSLRQKRIKTLQKKMDKELRAVEIRTAQMKASKTVKAMAYGHNDDKDVVVETGKYKKGDHWVKKTVKENRHKKKSDLGGLTDSFDNIGKSASSIADNIGKESVSEQKAVIISRYTVLIQQEQFQVNILLQELFAAQQEEKVTLER